MATSRTKAKKECLTQLGKILEHRTNCHLIPGHRTDGCGYYRGKYAYGEVNCILVKGRILCWTFIYDHYSNEVLFSAPCPTTPAAAQYPDRFKSRWGRKRD